MINIKEIKKEFPYFKIMKNSTKSVLCIMDGYTVHYLRMFEIFPSLYKRINIYEE